jgi:hypothetical protein
VRPVEAVEGLSLLALRAQVAWRTQGLGLLDDTHKLDCVCTVLMGLAVGRGGREVFLCDACRPDAPYELERWLEALSIRFADVSERLRECVQGWGTVLGERGMHAMECVPTVRVRDAGGGLYD